MVVTCYTTKLKIEIRDIKSISHVHTFEHAYQKLIKRN